MPRAWIVGLPLVALLLGLFVGNVLGPRWQLQRQYRERERQEKEHLAQLGQCLQLERWSLEREVDGGLLVRAAVRAGREGRVALDAHADQGNDGSQDLPTAPHALRGASRPSLKRPRVRPDRLRQGNDEILVPDVQRGPLLPAMVRAGEEVTLERHLRRVRPGDPDAISLRFSCRPPGPAGIFGVVEYATGVAREGSDGFGNVVRPLPPAR